MFEKNKTASPKAIPYVFTHKLFQRAEEFKASHVNASFKTIQLLGQILRNFQGKMLGKKKIEIAGACFSLTLRTVSSFLEFVRNERKDLLKIVEDKISEERRELATSEIKIRTQKYIFALSEFMVLAIMKHCSVSIGLRRLAPTFDTIFAERKSLPDSILSLAIKLDSSGEFPIEEVEQIYDPRKLSFFSQVLVRHLVWLNLYLYPVDYQVRQRAGKMVELDGTKKVFVKTEQKLLPSKGKHGGKSRRKILSRKEKKKRKHNRVKR